MAPLGVATFAPYHERCAGKLPLPPSAKWTGATRPLKLYCVKYRHSPNPPSCHTEKGFMTGGKTHAVPPKISAKPESGATGPVIAHTPPFRIQLLHCVCSSATISEEL